MVLNVNTNLGIAGKSNVFAPQASGIVSDSELTNVAKQILSATPAKVNVGQTRSSAVNTPEVKFFEAGYDVNTVRQAATNRTGFGMNLSQNALNSINSLKAQAAQNQVTNLTKAVDGKIHINSEKVDTSELKSAFLPNGPTDVEIFESANTNKDRRGPGGFYIPQDGSDEEAEEGLNLIA